MSADATTTPVAPVAPVEPPAPQATPEQRRQAAAAMLAKLNEKMEQADKFPGSYAQYEAYFETRRDFETALDAKAQYDLPTLSQFGARLAKIDEVLARDPNSELAAATEQHVADGIYEPQLRADWLAAVRGDGTRPLDVHSKANARVVMAFRDQSVRSQKDAERFRQLHQQAEAAKAEALALVQANEAAAASLKRKHEEEAAGLQRKLEEAESAFKKYKADTEARVALPPATAAAAAASTLGQHAAPPTVAAVSASATTGSPSAAELERAKIAAGEALYNKYKTSWMRVDPTATSRS